MTDQLYESGKTKHHVQMVCYECNWPPFDHGVAGNATKDDDESLEAHNELPRRPSDGYDCRKDGKNPIRKINGMESVNEPSEIWRRELKKTNDENINNNELAKKERRRIAGHGEQRGKHVTGTTKS